MKLTSKLLPVILLTILILLTNDKFIKALYKFIIKTYK